MGDWIIGLQAVMQPDVLLFALIGVLIGLIIGALPGLSGMPVRYNAYTVPRMTAQTRVGFFLTAQNFLPCLLYTSWG